MIAVSKDSNVPILPLFLALLSSSLFFIVNYLNLFSLTAASDPLEYVASALSPQNGFPYLDRLLLWLWIRFVALFPIPVEMVGGLSTLLLSSATLALLCWFLSKRISLFAGSLFSLLYISSPTILGIASYTYPMQLLAFVIVSAVVLLEFVDSTDLKLFVAGFSFGLILLCKIQGYAFGLYVLFLVLNNLNEGLGEVVKRACRAMLGFAMSISLVLIFIICVDGWQVFVSMFESYLSAGAKNQFAGRAAGGFPPFYFYLLEPTAVLSLAGLIVPFCGERYRAARSFALVGLFQLLGLFVIYFLTQRGGSLISNYFLDSYILGLFCFVYLVSSEFNKKINDYLFSTVVLSITFVYFTYLSVVVHHKNSIYTPIYLQFVEKWYFVVWLLIFCCLIYLILFKNRFFNKPLVVLILLACLVLPRMSEGVRDAKFRRDYHGVYHIVSKEIKRITGEGKKVWVSVKLNRSSIDLSTARLKMIFDGLYRNSDDDVYFGSVPPLYYDVLVTNRADLYASTSKKKYLIKW
jgi:hypothetical protein